MRAQYLAIKREHPDAILFYRMGDFYEMFGDDAKVASRILGITLTARGKGPEAIPMAGVPVRAADGYLVKLIRAGQRVAVCEQTQDPKEAKGLVDREVVRIVTAGTITEEEVLDHDAPNYLAASCTIRGRAGFAWLELSTGLFQISEVDEVRFDEELARIDPAELLVAEDSNPPLVAYQGTVRGCASFDFHPGEAEKELARFFGTKGLDGFGIDVDALAPAIGAAGALIRYVIETQKHALPHIRRIEVYERGSRMALDRATRQSLELVRTQRDGGKDGTLLHVMDRTRTPMGARLLRDRILAPFVDLETIRDAQGAVRTCFEDSKLREDIREALDGVQDLERLAARLSCGRAHARDLVALRHSMQRLPALHALLGATDSRLLTRLHESFDTLENLASMIEHRIADEPPIPLREGGLIRTGFDAELDELREIGRKGKGWMTEFEAAEAERAGIPTLRVGYNRVFGYYVEIPRSADTSSLPAHYVRKQTVKNAERYVTPELADFERKVLKSDEVAKAREYELFLELRDELAREVSRILDTARAVAEVDVAAALAEQAIRRGWCCPEVDESRELRLIDARHPVIEVRTDGEPFVPNDTILDPPTRSLIVLTGPNMAGKSTYIRQVALNVLLAQIGSYVPSREAKVGIVDRIFTRVGAADDIGRGASTFMVEMTETANILHNATESSLVILDEVGRGTSTQDGLSLAWAICEGLHGDVRCRALFATHYHELTTLAERFAGIHNAHVAVKEWNDEIVFLHRIEEGGTDKSYGLHVARLAGLPHRIVERARAILTSLEGGTTEIPRAVAEPKGPRQLDLFAPRVDQVANDLRVELRDIDVENLTPVRALVLLEELRAKARGR
ncbi:MAG: DNA mismatch repair protein MutS [Planctomycetes bacterium]|nr:DNA mismatch repair protein MutS [Planctomycetota bacterium]